MKASEKPQAPLYFLSFLGTSNYVPCHYVFDKDTEKEYCTGLVKYTQEAVLEAKARDAGKIVVFLTEDARSRNWEGEGKLKEQLDKMGYLERVEEVDVPNGFGRSQLLDIFEAFIRAVEPGARIIMDVTHAFRSLPLLSVTSLNYLKSLRNIAIEGIYYGAFEALGPAREVENIPPEKRKAEMIDLLVLNALQEWAAAVRVLMQYGNPDYLVALTKSNINPILAQTKGKDPIAVDLRKVVGFIEDAFAAVRFVRLKDIYGMSKADEAQKALESVLDNPKVLSPLRPVLKELKSLIGNLKENSLDNAWVVLDWCLKYEWYAIGVNLLCEHVLTAILAAHEKPHEDRAHRTTLSSAFNIRLNEISEEKWRVEDRDLAREMLDWEEVENEELVKFFAEKLANLRNDVQHAGMRENPAKRTKIAANFEGLLEEAKRYFLAAQTQA